jgi:hypothetical protein
MLSGRQQQAVKNINDTIFLIYILMIFEGALRKWFFQSLATPLFFIKDPFVVYIYFLVFYFRLTPVTKLLNYYFILFFIFIIIYLFCIVLLDYNFMVTFYGLRNYFMYLPLCFIIEKYFTEKDIIRIAKFTCIIAIPIAILTYIQFQSPPDSFINKNVESGTAVFTVVKDIVRPYGTFSFVTGQSLFTASILVMLLFNYFQDKSKKFLPDYLFYLCGLAFISNFAVSGSRTAVAYVGLIITFILFGNLILIRKKKNIKLILNLFLFIIISMVTIQFFFAAQIENLEERHSLASINEGGISGRLFSMFLGFIYEPLERTPFWGYGIGLSSGGGGKIATGQRAFLLDENEIPRILQEAGLVLGACYIFYRLSIAFSIFKNAIRTTFASNNPVSMAFAGFIILTLINGQVVGNGTVNTYTWLFVGFSMAANKIFQEEDEKEMPEIS